MNKFLCKGCSLFWDKFAFSPGLIEIMEINGVKYRVWYVDINADEAKSEIISEAKSKPVIIL